MVPRRTVCGEAVERSAGRSGTVNPSSTHELEEGPRTRRPRKSSPERDREPLFHLLAKGAGEILWQAL